MLAGQMLTDSRSLLVVAFVLLTSERHDTSFGSQHTQFPPIVLMITASSFFSFLSGP